MEAVQEQLQVLNKEAQELAAELKVAHGVLCEAIKSAENPQFIDTCQQQVQYLREEKARLNDRRTALEAKLSGLVPTHSGVTITRLVMPPSLLSHWRRMGALEGSVSPPLWNHPRLRATIAANFEAYWNKYMAKFQAAAASVRLVACTSEHTAEDRAPCYKAQESLLMALGGQLRDLAVEESTTGFTLTPVCLRNRTATQEDDGTNSAVDVLLCWTKLGETLESRNPYPQAATACEIKKVMTNDQASDGLLDHAVAQILDRASRCCAAKLERGMLKGRSGLLFGGAATNGVHMRSVVVWVPSTGTGSHAVYSNSLRIATEQAADGSRAVDVSTPAFAETVFHVWLSVAQEFDLQGGGRVGPQLQRDDTFVVSSDSDTAMADQSSLQITITSTELGILAGMATGQGAGSQPVLVKIGPAPLDQALALHLCLSWEPWHQVEREREVRTSLRKPVRNLAPLLTAGTVSQVTTRTASPDSCEGRSVLVLAATGLPLVPLGSSTLPVLSLDEVFVLLHCLLAAVVDLHAQSTWHCDINPSNIGVMSSATVPQQRYYLYDLGAAASPAVCAWARKLLLGSLDAWDSLSYTSAIANLHYSSLEALLGLPLTPSSDFQSVVYTAVALSGHVLPWAAAAAAGDKSAVVEARCALMEQPAQLPGVSSWPTALQRVAYAAIRREAGVVQAAYDVLAGCVFDK